MLQECLVATINIYCYFSKSLGVKISIWDDLVLVIVDIVSLTRMQI